MQACSYRDFAAARPGQVSCRHLKGQRLPTFWAVLAAFGTAWVPVTIGPKPPTWD